MEKSANFPKPYVGNVDCYSVEISGEFIGGEKFRNVLQQYMLQHSDTPRFIQAQVTCTRRHLLLHE